MAVTETRSVAAASGWFRYRAACQDGRVVRGRIWAESDVAAKNRLTSQGLFALKVIPATSRHSAYRKTDLAVVFRGLASLVGGGVSLTGALEASEGLASRRLTHGLAEASRRVREGRPLASALQQACPGIPQAVLGILAAGERGGHLAAALEEAAQQLEFDVELSSTVRSALAYPTIVLIVGLASVVVLGAVVVPRFATLIGDLGQEVPTATRVMLDVSLIMQRFWWLWCLLCAGIVLLGERWIRTDQGRIRMDQALLKMPMAGGIRMTMASSRACRSLAATLGAGLPLLRSLDIASIATGDAAVSARLISARERVRRGNRLSDALAKESALIPVAIRLLSIGERAGDLDVMALRAAEITSRQVRNEIKTLVSMLEPVLVIVLGGLVAMCALALLQAVYAVRPGVTP